MTDSPLAAGDCPDCHQPLDNPPTGRCAAARYHQMGTAALDGDPEDDAA